MSTETASCRAQVKMVSWLLDLFPFSQSPNSLVFSANLGSSLSSWK